MINYLLSLLKTDEYVSIYSNPNDPSAFIYGKVLAADDDDFVVYCISQDGEYDGLVLKKTDSVSRIEVEGQYNEKMKKLLNKDLPAVDIEFDKEGLVQSIMMYAEKEGCVVSVEIQNSGYDDTEGFVSEISENYCRIKQVDVCGYSDGIAVVKYDAITRISCGGTTEERLGRLFKINSKV